MSGTPLTFVSCLLGAGIASVVACQHSASPPPSSAAADAAASADSGVLPFQVDSPSVYVAKVKNILVGLPPSDAEVKAVESDPTQLKTLIDGWMALPPAPGEPFGPYETKMLRFFQLAFQQTQVTITDFADQAYPGNLIINNTSAPLFVQNATESFARTVLAQNEAGSPLNGAITTETLMMTPAMMEVYAFLDAYQVDDLGNVTDSFAKANPQLKITVEAAAGPIPFAQSMDPSSPNYMHFYDADVGNGKIQGGATCNQDPIVLAASGFTLHQLLYGAIRAHKTVAGVACGQYGGTASASQLVASDYTTWKMVTIRPPAAGESTTPFYDLASLRTSNELVLSLPRVGFFTTPAFAANWQTNTSNTMRVTTNQSLIVATGAQVDGTDETVPPSTPGLDIVHDTAGCIGCHQTLDPTRSILAATYSFYYHEQTDPTYSGQKGLFAFQGVIKSVNTVNDFAATLASHPLFAKAWVEKLCYWANSSVCDVTDPEFLRVVGVFQSSQFAWNTLVRELLSSPLTTNAVATATTTDSGEVIAVSRRDHLCAALNNRLGFTDVCGLDVFTPTKAGSSAATVADIVSGLPSDGYGRGAVAPVLPNAPTLFYRAGTENICEAVAALTIDVPAGQEETGVTQWSSTQKDAAIADFVQIVMALTPSDPRSAPAQALLESHYASALATGASPTNALQSTFTAACLAPTAISIGL